MAQIVIGMGASHTPLLTLESEDWLQRAAADHANPALNLSDGRQLTYAELFEEVGPKYADQVTAELLASKATHCAQSLDHLASALEAAAPDIVIIVGDDQRELFDANNQPVVGIYHGSQIRMNDKFGHEAQPSWVKQMGKGYLMDDIHQFPGAPDFALELIAGLMREEVDVTSIADVPDAKTAGFGHAYGFIVQRLLRKRPIPVVPLLLNTYYPPNVPTSKRAYHIGKALARAVDASSSNARVAVIASGGLSHFVVDEVLDRGVLDAFARADENHLCSIPSQALMSGSSEILNWVLTAGAVSHLPLAWQSYEPLYRTPAGTGVGAGFAIWK